MSMTDISVAAGARTLISPYEHDLPNLLSYIVHMTSLIYYLFPPEHSPTTLTFSNYIQEYLRR